MTQHGRREPRADRERAARERRIAELRRRIEALEALDESAFGRFTEWDWVVCILISVIGPVAALWWAHG